MSTHRSNGFLILALLALVVLQLAKAQSDVYQYQQQQQPQQQPLKRQGPSQYCGKLLSHTLQLVCKGHYNKPLYKKSGQEMDTEDWNEWSNDDSYPFRSRSNAMAMITGRFGAGRFRRESRGVHDECCVKPCSLEELLSYCG